MSQYFENQKEKAKKQLEEILEDMEKFTKILSNDYKFSRQVLKKDSANQMLRRMVVRNFCALVEGQIHQWKWMALNFFKIFEVRVEDAETALLREETYDLDNKGHVAIKRQNLQVGKNFKFSCEMFARVCGCSYVPDFDDNGWDCLLKVFEVRNRLMHPKQSKGVEVNDTEVLLLQRAHDWFLKVRLGLFGSIDLNKVLRNCRSNN